MTSTVPKRNPNKTKSHMPNCQTTPCTSITAVLPLRNKPSFEHLEHLILKTPIGKDATRSRVRKSSQKRAISRNSGWAWRKTCWNHGETPKQQFYVDGLFIRALVAFDGCMKLARWKRGLLDLKLCQHPCNCSFNHGK